MKIVKSGNRKKNPYEGRMLRCEGCGCKFMIEAADKVKTMDDRDGTNKYFGCPECKGFCWVI